MFAIIMAEWLSRSTSEQMVVLSNPIIGDFIFLCQLFIYFFFFYFFFSYNIHDMFFHPNVS